MHFLPAVLVLLRGGLVSSLDDSTMSLLSRVDPIPISSGFVELEGRKPVQLQDESYVPFSGLQLAPLAREPLRRGVSSSRANNLKKLVPKSRKFLVAKKTVSKQGTGAVVAAPTPTPDVYMCFMASGKVGLSGRQCDQVRAGSDAALIQTLHCTQALNPATIGDLMTGAQTSPVDFTQNAQTAVADLISMDTPVSIQVTTGSCTRIIGGQIPDLQLDKNYAVFVAVNPLSQQTAETYQGLGVSYRTSTFRAGIVFAAIDAMFGASSVLKQMLATHFTTDVANCNADGVCSSRELVQWVPSGPQHVDWLDASSDNFVRILS